MDIKNLTYVLEAYRCQSINKAAKNVFISQSHLSNIIKHMEEEVGYPIFIRTATGLTATSEGHYFLDNAAKIVANWDGILNVPNQIRNRDTLTVCSTPSSSVVNYFLDFRKLYPSACNDTFMESGLYSTIQNIVNQGCRIGILGMPERQIQKYRQVAEDYRLDFKVLKQGVPIRIYMSEMHPLASKPAVTSEDLRQYPLVIDVNVEREDLLSSTGEASRALYVSDRGTTYEAMVRDDYLMAGIVSPETLKRLPCVSKKLLNGDLLAFCFIKSRLCTLPPRERHFLAYLQERLDAFEIC